MVSSLLSISLFNNIYGLFIIIKFLLNKKNPTITIVSRPIGLNMLFGDRCHINSFF